MKKRYGCIGFLLALSLLAGCSDGQSAAGRNAGGAKTVDDILEEGLKETQASVGAPPATSTPTPTPGAEVTAVPEEPVVLSTTEGIDVDLTILSSTMVYSEVYNMMSVPEDYIGKTIKMEGSYSYCRDDVSGAEYYACIIQDATACCSQGLEFVPENPEAVPAEGESVTVVGVFDTYLEGDYMYCTLRDATIL
ncbi:MAG: hypothetical protein IK115_01925 [Lachnospiraceae bacterium]|nr:hypothetical protein [Lachnospiraceae bacterium]